jgi:methionyl-tRNA formyltransferase
MEAIYKSGGRLDFAMTLPDDKALTKSGRVFIDDFCSGHSIPLFKSGHVNNLDVIDQIKRADLDWLFIIGWSQIASQDVLDAPHKGVLGMHPTLLPEGRGRAAIPWAILKSLDKTGVTLFKMDHGVDTGPIAAQIEIPLSITTTATQLYEYVDAAHVQLINKIVPLILNDRLELRPQNNSLATEWPGRKPEDGRINIDGSVVDADKIVRAVTRPYPGAFYLEDGKKYIIWTARVLNEGEFKNSCETYLNFNDGVLHLQDFEVVND